MKLIDLLVKELPKRGGWPIKVTSIGQDYDRELMFYGRLKPRTGIILDDLAVDHRKCGDSGKGVTRTQYEAALAASEGWIEWGGGECPVEKGTLVDVRYRDGQEMSALPANDIAIGMRDASYAFWHNDGNLNDIIAYRLHKPDINSRANDDRLEQDLNECIGQDVDIPEWNGDGLPPIGCACEMQDSKGTWLPVEIIAKNDGFTFGWSYDYRIVFFGDKADEFRPLRTEAEKKRDEAAEAIDFYMPEYIPDTPNEFYHAKKIYDAIAAGKIPGVKLDD